MSRREPLWFAVVKLLLWVGGVLFFFRVLVYVAAFLGGDIRDFWLSIAGASTVFIVFWGGLLKRCHFPGHAENHQPEMSASCAEANALVFSRESQIMTEKPKVIIQSPGSVTINNSTTHNNVQGGIIGSGSVTVHQHFDKTQPSAPPPDAQPAESVALIPMKETANLDELLTYAETLLGKPIAENTVRNILERAGIESCGDEKRGRARPKLYPKEQAEKAIADYAVANKSK